VPSRADRPLLLAVVAGAMLAAAPLTAHVSHGDVSASARTVLVRADVERALESIRTDPNLAQQRTIKTLRWKRATDTSSRPAWLSWVIGLFRWIDQSARILVWCGAALLIALLVVWVLRAGRAYEARRDDEPFDAPTHVGDLDIRPETLPVDVGDAAKDLWDRGQRRAALALLYRGLLSRLAHVDRLAIRASTTEGDCVRLVATLPPSRRRYASEVVGVWQRFTYGGEDARTAAVHVLCDEFAAVFNADLVTQADVPGHPA